MKQQITIITDQNKSQLIVKLEEDVKFVGELSKLNDMYNLVSMLRALGFKVKKEILEVRVD